MSWCFKEELCQLIQVGRLSPAVSPEERQCADLRFIDLCQHSINVGDVLIEIALDPSISTNIRLTSSLAVEPIITEWGWKEGNRFSDKHALSSSLVNYFSSEVLSSELSTLVKAILRFLAKIIILEFSSTEHWGSLLSSCAAEALNTGGYGLELLLHLSEGAKTSPLLWLFLAKNVAELWIESLRSHVAFRSDGFKFIFNLLCKRCKPSEEKHFALSDVCFILQEGMATYMFGVLQQQMQQAPSQASELKSRTSFFKETEFILQISYRLVKNVEAAAKVFECGSFFIINLQSLYLTEWATGLSEETVLITESSLSCIQDILMSYPEGCYPNLMETVNAVIPFLIRLSEENGEDSYLTDLIMEDETVPLGCGGDDVASITGSILELFLEAHPEHFNSLLRSLLPLSKQVEQQINFRAGMSFLSSALYHISRVCVSSNRCAADEFEDAGAFFPQLFNTVLQGLHNDNGTSELLYSLSQCFLHCSNETSLTQYVCFIESVLNQSPSLYLRGVAMHGLSAVLQSLEPSMKHHIVQVSWLEMALTWAASSDSQLPFFCFVYAVNVILQIEPDMKYTLLTHEGIIPSLLDHYCHFSVTRAVPKELLIFLSMLMSHNTSPMCSMITCIILHVSEYSANIRYAQSPLILKQLSLFLLNMTMQITKGDSGCCQSCLMSSFQQLLPLLAKFGATLGPFDEGTSRSLVTCFGAAAIVGGAVEEPHLAATFLSTCRILEGSVSEKQSAPLISAACASLAMQCIAQPTFIDENLSSVVEIAFSGDMINGRKGVNYLGSVIFLSVAAIRSPQTFHQRFLAMHSSSKYKDAAWQAAIGWCCSLAPFADVLTWKYILCGWLVLLNYIFALAPEQQTIFLVSFPHITFFPFPSVFARSVPSQLQAGLSVFEAVVAGLMWVKHCPSRATQVSGFRKEFHSLLDIERLFPRVTTAITLDSIGFSQLSDLSQQDAAEALLQKLSEMGFDSIIQQQLKYFVLFKK